MAKTQSVSVTAYLFAVFGFLFGVIALGIALFINVRPPLVGYGCSGAGGDLYAYSESDFPACVEIVGTRG